MSIYKSEIMGTVNTLVLYAHKAQQAIEDGWEEPDTMLTPQHVERVRASLAEAKRAVGRTQEAFKKFEAVADARKQPTGV